MPDEQRIPDVTNRPRPGRYVFVRTHTGEKRHVAVEFSSTTVCGVLVAQQLLVHETPPLCGKCQPYANDVKPLTFEQSLQWVREHGGPAAGVVASLDAEMAGRSTR
jgi:hypothetical protein